MNDIRGVSEKTVFLSNQITRLPQHLSRSEIKLLVRQLTHVLYDPISSIASSS